MSKKRLMLLHGALGAGSQFESWQKAMSEHFELVIFDFEGHGLYSPGHREYRIENFSEQLEIVLHTMDALGAGVFGYSMGGYVAMHLAAQKPGLIGKIFTVGTKFDWTPEYAAKESRFLNPDLMQEKVPSFANLLKERHGEDWKAVVNKTAEMMTSLGANPLLGPEQFKAMDIPVRLGLGDKDSTASIEENTAVFRQLPKGELAILPATGHPIERIKMEVIVPMMVEFFGK